MNVQRIERAVQVVCDHGGKAGSRWSGGTGYLVGGSLVLTAAHVLAGEAAVSVRTVRGDQFPARRRPIESRFDVAVLEVVAPDFRGPAAATFGQVDRLSDEMVPNCSVVGFPRFKQHDSRSGDLPLRDTAHIRGEINPKANLPTGELEFRISSASTPGETGELGGSQWQGMSGAVLRARYPKSEDLALGVITTQLTPEGAATIRAVPIVDLLAEPGWAGLLGVADPRALPKVPYVAPEEASPYWSTVADLESRTPLLLDRDTWLEHFATFARSELGYAWLVGPRWSGKTALQAHFAMHKPPDLDVVVFFLSSKADADSRRFLAVVNDQLARLVGEPQRATQATTGQVDTYRTLWELAERRAHHLERPLVLLVDGIDDDLSAPRDLPSVASLLPRLKSPRAHVMVTGRARPDIPADVDVSHPIYQAEEVWLDEPSPTVRARTRDIERRLQLCPSCKRRDVADAVPTIADAGYWGGAQSARSFEASAVLAFPAKTTKLTRRQRRWIIAGVLFGFLLMSWGSVAQDASATAAQENSASSLTSLGVLLEVGLGIFGVVWFSYRASMRAANERARLIWQTLWYCNRDGVVYQPETGVAFSPVALESYVFQKPLVQRV